MRIQAAPLEHLPWLVNRVGLEPTAGLRALECVTDDGEILGMVGFTDWRPNSFQMHVAVDSPARCRKLLTEAFGYAFAERGVAVGLTSAGNERAVTLARKLGFRQLARIPEGHAPGVDLIVFAMRKTECRWLPIAQRKAA